MTTLSIYARIFAGPSNFRALGSNAVATIRL